ncbi:hypothetical protein FGO68_gene2582 [Halteria grandinella]|uniref:Uncharacterized protein n=1 Tax=Halteria grandinella TaxID=5974 RepID=A0A8J8NMD7_HALGN|nr:hypothetical protein FGO68_gene2582 [Halteria grandinella]
MKAKLSFYLLPLRSILQVSKHRGDICHRKVIEHHLIHSGPSYSIDIIDKSTQTIVFDSSILALRSFGNALSEYFIKALPMYLHPQVIRVVHEAALNAILEFAIQCDLGYLPSSIPIGHVVLQVPQEPLILGQYHAPSIDPTIFDNPIKYSFTIEIVDYAFSLEFAQMVVSEAHFVILFEICITKAFFQIIFEMANIDDKTILFANGQLSARAAELAFYVKAFDHLIHRGCKSSPMRYVCPIQHLALVIHGHPLDNVFPIKREVKQCILKRLHILNGTPQPVEIKDTSHFFPSLFYFRLTTRQTKHVSNVCVPVPIVIVGVFQFHLLAFTDEMQIVEAFRAFAKLPLYEAQHIVYVSGWESEQGRVRMSLQQIFQSLRQHLWILQICFDINQ